jgi:hypothetical protein
MQVRQMSVVIALHFSLRGSRSKEEGCVIDKDISYDNEGDQNLYRHDYPKTAMSALEGRGTMSVPTDGCSLAKWVWNNK